MMTSTKNSVDLANSSDKKIMYEFAKKMHSDERAPRN